MRELRERVNADSDIKGKRTTATIMNTHHLPSSSSSERKRDSIAVVLGGVRAINDSVWQSETRLRSQGIHPARDRENLAVIARVRVQANIQKACFGADEVGIERVLKVQMAAEVPA